MNDADRADGLAVLGDLPLHRTLAKAAHLVLQEQSSLSRKPPQLQADPSRRAHPHRRARAATDRRCQPATNILFAPIRTTTTQFPDRTGQPTGNRYRPCATSGTSRQKPHLDHCVPDRADVASRLRIRMGSHIIVLHRRRALTTSHAVTAADTGMKRVDSLLDGAGGTMWQR